jgi:hypothetical protein
MLQTRRTAALIYDGSSDMSMRSGTRSRTYRDPDHVDGNPGSGDMRCGSSHGQIPQRDLVRASKSGRACRRLKWICLKCSAYGNVRMQRGRNPT